MIERYYVVRVNEWYIKNVYGSTYPYLCSTLDLYKAKKYKNLKAASKLKDRLDAYYESEGITSGRDVVIVEVEVNIKLREL